MPLQVDLVSADSSVWSGEAGFVVARTIEGDMGVFPGHAPVLAVLAAGEVRIEPAGGGQAVVANVEDGGFISIEHDRVTVVSDTATLVSGSAER